MTRFKFLLFLITGCLLLSGTLTPVFADDRAKIEQLEKLIMQQQKMIESQSKAIESLQDQISQIQEKTVAAPAAAEADQPTGFWKSGNKNADVKLYGQVNRGVLISDDGNDTTVYQVDNDNSSTRIGLAGSIKASEDIETGTKIEVQFESNSSGDVNQNDRRGSNVGTNNFTKRHLDLYLKSQQWGKLSVGFGSTASDSTLESDLSGTSLVGYSSVTDMAAGQFFYDKLTGSLDTNVTVGDVFSNMDGLGRDDRIRYDTPSFKGISASGSYIADGGGDFALRYSKKYDNHTVAAAASFSNPGGTNDKTDYQYGTSLSVLHKSGLNLSFSLGQREFKDDTDGDGLYYYTKLGYIAEYFSIGKSAFSIDYGMFEDINQVNDEATTFGLQFVQNIENWGTEYYLGFRQYGLDSDNNDYDDINAVLSGFRIKF